MKNFCSIASILVILSLLLVTAGCTQAPPATPTPAGSPDSFTVAPSPTTASLSNETMVAFVKEAVAYAKTHDKNATLREFSDKNGSFVRGTLYIYAYDFDGVTLAHPFNPEKIGMSRLDEQDALGTLFITNLRNAAQSGSGFVEFSYINPAHNSTVEKKLGYVEKVNEDWWLGSGIYFGPVTAPARKAPATSAEIKDYVDNAAAYATKNGKEMALAAFNNRTGPFVTGDVYVYALDYNGTARALPFQPEQVGTSFLTKTDSAGKPYTATEIQLAREGGGYILYHYPEPADNTSSNLKISYVRPVDDTYWIGAGIYTTEDRLIDTGLKAFVNEAKAIAKTNGRDKAVAEFNNLNGSFIKSDLYIFAYDNNGTVLAWPYRPDQIGINRINATDPAGTGHVRAFIDTAKNGGGMVDYYSVNPATNTTQLKISYVTDIDGTWMLGSGRYLEPGPVILSP